MMLSTPGPRRPFLELEPERRALPLVATLVLASALGACASARSRPSPLAGGLAATAAATRPTPDPRPTLRPGLFDAGEAAWNMRLVSTTQPPRDFVGGVNSDLAFRGRYAIQGNFSGIQIWDISDPRRPEIVTSYVCPASQSDVSVYGNLLFVSGEGFEGRLDCGTTPPRGAVSPERLRGIRIFDISDVRRPRYLGNVQTCRGSHTHTLLEHPGDPEHVYIYVSGSAPVRPAAELAGCSGALPEEDPNTALFRIEVIRVPLAAPERAEIVSSPRIVAGLSAPPTHGLAPAEQAVVDSARAAGAFILELPGEPQIMPDEIARMFLDTLVARRGGSGAPTAADSAELRSYLDGVVQAQFGGGGERRYGPTQCHDITVFPEVGLAGGACEGYGLLLDIRNPANPTRVAAVSDENFAYWHSATFDAAGTKILFTDEWGGGSQAKCRASDPPEWGANAIFTIEGRELRFRSYYKLPASQAEGENCVAHNGSLIPVPGRDVMAQAWYQGGISVFDWTDPENPVEIAYHDRGPAEAGRPSFAGSWSVYWYNGVLVSSEIARGLDIFELLPSPLLTQNEIDAAKTVRFEYLNAQTQRRFVFPPSFALAHAYLDQLERSGGLDAARIAAVRERLAAAGRASGASRRDALDSLAMELDREVRGSRDANKVRTLVESLRALAREE